MPKEPSYYDILGLRPEADTAAIDGAYRGRSLRFRVGMPRAGSAEQTGPTQEQVEQAYAILGDPDSRALYDAVYFPNKQPPPRRRRIPIWLWAIIGIWVVALLAVILFGLRSRTQSDGGAIGRVAGPTATIVAGGVASATTSIAASGGVNATTSVPASGGIGVGSSPSSAAALPSTTVRSTAVDGTTTVAAVANTTTATTAPTTAPSATQTSARTATTLPTNTATAPTNTATAPPPTATTAPPPTEVPPTEIPATVAPEPTPVPPPPPTATPTFRSTDRIGTPLSVNLRTGPGANYASLGLLPTGTLLQATGESATVSGQLWRRFILQDGRVGWVRDLDVLPTR